MKPILISSGEPAGIGPDLCLALSAHVFPVVVLGDPALLEERAHQLNLQVELNPYAGGSVDPKPGRLAVLPLSCAQKVKPGTLDSKNASYVMEMLALGIEQCLEKKFSALVTAPVHKAVLNEGGYSFTGHTEFLAERCCVESVVMMLACETLKVALATTHLPLREVSRHIDQPLLQNVLHCLNRALIQDFGIPSPRILVAGLNPHAGEGGYLGDEELKTIIPALKRLKQEGLNVRGPMAADTLFTPEMLKACDVVLAMYHDQGLPVLKYAGFGHAANITLGLPIVRTSVDHGTALELAGTGLADAGSLLYALKVADVMAKTRNAHAVGH